MSTPPATLPLEAPLPREVSGSGQGWLMEYRRYPVFSWPWVKGRRRLALLTLLIILVIFAPGVLFAADPTVPLSTLLSVLLQWASPLLLGPLAGAWVRRRNWPPAREQRALWGAIVAVILAGAAYTQWGAEPVKQFSAEQLGAVGPDGKRLRVTMAIGVTVMSTDDDGARPASAGARDGGGLAQDIFNHVFGAFVAFSFGGGFAVLRWRREQELLQALARDRALAEAETRRREAELRLSVLAAQVEPHFLFNTLAGVRSAIATDPARASDMVDRLVTYLRAAIPRLRSDGGVAATLGGQVDLVRAYLALMQSRMPRLAFEIDVPPPLALRPFPPLMLISLAENAVQHGVEPKVGPARISVRAEVDDTARLAVTVADDGVGFGGGPQADAAGSGLGLTNLRERLQQLYGGRAGLTLRSRPDGGVAATIAIPQDDTPQEDA